MRTLLCTIFVLLLLPTLAEGATIGMQVWSETDRSGKTFDRVGARWQTAVGESSAVELRFEEGTFFVRDSRAPIVPGDHCTAAADGWVECRSPRPDLPAEVNFQFGDLDDSLHVIGGAWRGPLYASGDGGRDRLVVDAAIGSVLSGGDGSDLLQGGPSHDTLSGDAGADELHGGDGDDKLAGYGQSALSGFDQPDVIDGGPGENDVVSYGGREDALTVDLQAGRGGIRAEDTLTGVEGIAGGSRGDVLRGTAGPNTIDGGWSDHDVIEGFGGDDRLTGRGTGTQITGGEGDDDILAFSGAAADAGPGDDTLRGFDLVIPVVCGPGTDTVVSMQGTHELPPAGLDCERFETPLFTLTAVRTRGTRLTFVARGTYPASSRLCGMRAFVRDGASGRELSRTAMKLPNGRRRALALAARTALPGFVRVELRPQRCDRRGRLRLADRQPIVRVPLQRGAGVG
jgi:hypothetical protein